MTAPPPAIFVFDDETGVDDYGALYLFIYRQRIFAIRQAAYYAALAALLYAAYLALDLYVQATTGAGSTRVWVIRSLPVEAAAALPWALAGVATLFVVNRWLVLPWYARKLGRTLLAAYREALPADAASAIPSHNRLDADGLRSRSPCHEIAIAWPLVRRIVETRDHVLLMNSEGTGAIFRKAALALAGIDDIRAAIGERLGRGGPLVPADRAEATFVVETATTIDDMLAASTWAARRKRRDRRQMPRWLAFLVLIVVCMAIGLLVGAGSVSALVSVLADARFAWAIAGLVGLYALAFLAWRLLTRGLGRLFQRRILEDFRRGLLELQAGARGPALCQTMRIGPQGVALDGPGLRQWHGWALIEAFGEDAERFYLLTTLGQAIPLPKAGIPAAEAEPLRQFVGAQIAAVPRRNRKGDGLVGRGAVA